LKGGVKMNNIFELDFLGGYYASTVNENNSGVFSISVHLKESLNHKVLKQAMNRVVERFPFLSGRLRPNFFNYAYEITNDTIPFISVEKVAALENNSQIFKVIYGERDFTLKVNHILCDGRTLAKVAQALLICYFKLLGINPDGADHTILNEPKHLEELENAYLRYLNDKSIQLSHAAKKKSKKISVYRPTVPKNIPIEMVSYQLSVSAIKKMAKSYQATISEFLLALIFKSVQVERATFNSKEPIIASVPIDCRSFFPSKTIRNFVTAENVVMPEVEDLATMVKRIQSAFKKIDEQSVYQGFNPLQRTYQAVRYLPRVLKDWYMRRIGNLKSNGYTTGFSNIGKIALPEKIEDRIEFMEFFAETDGISPYYFSCVTTADTLTLSVTLKVDNEIVINELEKHLKAFLI
jgi:NRPS condensation-like uncharacterized protein